MSFEGVIMLAAQPFKHQFTSFIVKMYDYVIIDQMFSFTAKAFFSDPDTHVNDIVIIQPLEDFYPGRCLGRVENQHLRSCTD